jgi:hypothetical protein
LYGCGTYCLTLREDYRLRVLDNRVLKKKFGPKGEGATVDWEKNCTLVNFVTYCSPNVMYIQSNREQWDGWGMWYLWRRREIRTGLWCGSLNERDHFEDIVIDRILILKCIFKNRMRDCGQDLSGFG